MSCYSARLPVVGPTFYLCLCLCEAAKWCHLSLLAVDLHLLSKFHWPTCSLWNSSSVIVFVRSFGHLSGQVLLSGFKHIATYFLISWLVSSPLKWPTVPWVSISNLTIKGRMPISPLSCLKFVNCQHSWQKATKSCLFSVLNSHLRQTSPCLACITSTWGDATSHLLHWWA